MKNRVTAITVFMCLILALLTGCGGEHIHFWEDGICGECGKVCKHEWNDGLCGVCNLVCDHRWDDDVRCTVCSLKLEDDFTLLPAKSENGNIYGAMYTPSVYYGKLKTVIVCHGFGVNASAAVARYLARRGFAAYAFDFCGGSPATRSDMAFEDMSVKTEKADLLAVLDTVCALSYVDDKNVYLYGESQGGLVVAVTAPEIEERIAGIILMYPGFSICSSMAMLFGSLGEVKDTVDVLGKTMKRTYAEAIFEYLPNSYEKITDDGTAYEFMQKRLEVTKTLYEYIAGFTKRVVIFHGTADALVDIAFSREAVKYYENAKLIEVEGGNHSFAGDDLKEVMRLTDRFLRGLSFD